MEFLTIAKSVKETGLSYLGGVNTSSKIMKGDKKGVDTYIIYLSPAESSGYNVCPMATKECIKSCLHESGHNRIDTKLNRINNARIKKTKMYFENRNMFVSWVVAEIKKFKQKAEENNREFAVRINGTSDLNIETMKLDNKNLFQLFPDVQFYDYTKVFNRVNLLDKYPNYDLTFSYSGSNWIECEAALSMGMRVAVVFEKVPAFYKGFEVINGDETDLRYLDQKNVIVGLKFKKIRNKIDFTTQNFIVQETDKHCIY